jgi:hypothetical protein
MRRDAVCTSGLCSELQCATSVQAVGTATPSGLCGVTVCVVYIKSPILSPSSRLLSPLLRLVVRDSLRGK